MRSVPGDPRRVPASWTVRAAEDVEAVLSVLCDGKIHVVRLASFSTAKNSLALLASGAEEFLTGVTVAGISIICAAAAARYRVSSQVIPDLHTRPALVTAPANSFGADPL